MADSNDKNTFERIFITNKLSDDLHTTIGICGSFEKALNGYSSYLSEHLSIDVAEAKNDIREAYIKHQQEPPEQTVKTAKENGASELWQKDTKSVDEHKSLAAEMCPYALEMHYMCEAYYDDLSNFYSNEQAQDDSQDDGYGQ